jgi:hypothetical protein
LPKTFAAKVFWRESELFVFVDRKNVTSKTLCFGDPRAYVPLPTQEPTDMTFGPANPQEFFSDEASLVRMRLITSSEDQARRACEFLSHLCDGYADSPMPSPAQIADVLSAVVVDMCARSEKLDYERRLFDLVEEKQGIEPGRTVQIVGDEVRIV